MESQHSPKSLSRTGWSDSQPWRTLALRKNPRSTLGVHVAGLNSHFRVLSSLPGVLPKSTSLASTPLRTTLVKNELLLTWNSSSLNLEVLAKNRRLILCYFHSGLDHFANKL